MESVLKDLRFAVRGLLKRPAFTAIAKEIAIRTALGASRWRLMRQLLTESAILALAGGLLGLLLSTYGVTAITKLLPQTFPRLDEIGMDWRVFGFTLGASLLTGFIFGFALVVRSTVEPETLAPALRQAVAEVDRTVPVAQVQTMELNPLIALRYE